MTDDEAHPCGEAYEVDRGETTLGAGEQLKADQGRSRGSVNDVVLPKEERSDREDGKD